MTSFYVPMTAPADVIPHLKKGAAHYKENFSAHALATTWFAAGGVPSAVRTVLDSHAVFAGLTFIHAFFEQETDLLDGLRGNSHTDLLALFRGSDGYAVIAVEGKVEETFARKIGEQTGLTVGQRKRLAGLAAMMGCAPAALPGLRYQLFHRSMAAVLEAEHYGARKALMLVHSFSDAQTGFADFSAFVGSILDRVAPRIGQITGPKKVRGVDLHFAWVADRLPGLTTSLAPVGTHRGKVSLGGQGRRTGPRS